MQGENDLRPPHPHPREDFIRDLARVEIAQDTVLTEPPPPRGIGYHLRWIVINVILVAVGAYTFTHYLTERALGPSEEVEEPTDSRTATQRVELHAPKPAAPAQRSEPRQ